MPRPFRCVASVLLVHVFFCLTYIVLPATASSDAAPQSGRKPLCRSGDRVQCTLLFCMCLGLCFVAHSMSVLLTFSSLLGRRMTLTRGTLRTRFSSARYPSIAACFLSRSTGCVLCVCVCVCLCVSVCVCLSAPDTDMMATATGSARSAETSESRAGADRRLGRHLAAA
jgi:hypothetical protein